jgi:hypothetical protein
MKAEEGCSYHPVMVLAPQSSQFSHYKINLVTLLKHFVLSRVFVGAEMRLPSRCLATKRETNFTEPLLSNDRRDTHRLMGGMYEVSR